MWAYRSIFAVLFIFFIGAYAGEEKISASINGPDTAAPKLEYNPPPFKIPKQFEKQLGDYRKKFFQLSGFEFSGLHWKQFVRVYVNQDAQTYLNNFKEYVRIYLDNNEANDTATRSTFQPYLVGTIFLKENYRSDNDKPGIPTFLTIMIKHKPGYDPKGNDWEYLQIGQDGNIYFQGKGDHPGVKAMCAKCHSNMAERDYIFSTFCSVSSMGR